MTRRRGRPRPEGGERKLRSEKNFGLNFRSLFITITKIITKINVPRNYFVIISARIVMVLYQGKKLKGNN